jgi:hypothetical protein
MKVPTHLQHQPIIAVNNYDSNDGIYTGNTDARALSIGIAQYDSNEFSAKIFRHTGDKWSRQSEELPLHRVLDLAILLASVMKRQTADEPSLTTLPEEVISASGFNDLKNYLANNAKHILPRLAELKSLL